SSCATWKPRSLCHSVSSPSKATRSSTPCRLRARPSLGTMTTARRIGAEDSATRAALLDAAQALMMEEGYAAVTSRKVAARAGLKPPLVHYYFRTMDDLFVALVRRGADEARQRQDAALASDQPLWSLWETTTHPAGRTVITEIA